MSLLSIDGFPQFIYPTTFLEETKVLSKSCEEQNSTMSSIQASVPTTTLTNTAVWIHENALRIESELQYLERQIQLLHEQDLVLTQIGERIHALDSRTKSLNGCVMSTNSSIAVESGWTNLD